VRGKIYLICALIFAAGAAVSTYLYLESVKQSYREVGEYVTVVTAAINIPARTNVTSEMVRSKEMPQRFVHPDAARSVQDVAGKIALSDIAAGEPVLKTKLAAQQDTSHGLAYKLKEGERAVTVAVNDVSSVAAMVQPEDKVDVLVTLEDPTGGDAKGGSCTTTMLSNMRVIATGQTLVPRGDPKGATFPTVTFAATPLQAQLLVLASERGSIRLTLRMPVDEGVVKLPPSRLTDLVSVLPAPQPTIRPAPVPDQR
jgi:pilus assembly protein CpaB